MRQAFAHDAVVTLEPGGDERAPGAAITVALCGHGEHPPPCPLAPHHTDARRTGDKVRLRVLFVADPAVEPEVRDMIDAALARGRTDADRTTRWRFDGAHPAEVGDDETAHAERLAQG